MLEPLKQYICDTCHTIIEKPEDGVIEWLDSANESVQYHYHSFRIIHSSHASPKQNNINGCYRDNRDGLLNDRDLTYFLSSEDGMAHILSLVLVESSHSHEEPVLRNPREYIELFRRLTIPYYEEARQHWSTAIEDGYFDTLNDFVRYRPDTLRRLIEQFTEEKV